MADVVVLGSFMMDLVIRAPRRPRAGETLVGTGFDAVPRRQGLQPGRAPRPGPAAATAMVGRVGDDEYGRRFLDRPRRARASTPPAW